MKIPFDIKYRPQIESGKYKVVTRDDRPARIICWNRKSAGDGQPIVALVENGHYENSIWVEENGVYKGTMGHEYDLFIITPEPELTEFEEMLYSIFDAYNGLKIDVRAAVDANAKTLLAIAKKEICRGCSANLEGYLKGKTEADKDYQQGYMDGYKAGEESKYYHYPTYEPPCHHGGVCTNPMKDCINCPRTGGDIGISTTSGTCKKD